MNTEQIAAEQTDLLLQHQLAVQRWLACPPIERPHYWRAVENAWRTVKDAGITLDAQQASRTLAINHGKIRSIK